MISEEKNKTTITWRIVEKDARTEEVIRDTSQVNVITTLGLNFFAEALANYGVDNTSSGGSGRFNWYLLLGSGVEPINPSSADTTLKTIANGSSKQGTVTSSGAQTLYYARYLPEDANGYTYTEAGIYDRCPFEVISPPSGPTYASGRLINHLALSPSLVKDDTKLVDFYITVQFS